VREHAATALGMIGKDDDAYHVLVEAYETDASTRVRAHAAFGLGLMREERAIDLLIDGLRSQHSEIRSHCAEALGMIGDDRAVSRLNEVLSDPDPDVRRSAERALRMIRGR
jgi:HEAT repeat protein